MIIVLKCCMGRNGAQAPRQPCSELFFSGVSVEARNSFSKILIPIKCVTIKLRIFMKNVQSVQRYSFIKYRFNGVGSLQRPPVSVGVKTSMSFVLFSHLKRISKAQGRMNRPGMEMKTLFSKKLSKLSKSNVKKSVGITLTVIKLSANVCATKVMGSEHLI